MTTLKRVPFHIAGRKFMSFKEWRRHGRPTWQVLFQDADGSTLDSVETTYPAEEPLHAIVTANPVVAHRVRQAKLVAGPPTYAGVRETFVFERNAVIRRNTAALITSTQAAPRVIGLSDAAAEADRLLAAADEALDRARRTDEALRTSGESPGEPAAVTKEYAVKAPEDVTGKAPAGDDKPPEEPPTGLDPAVFVSTRIEMAVFPAAWTSVSSEDPVPACAPIEPAEPTPPVGDPKDVVFIHARKKFRLHKAVKEELVIYRSGNPPKSPNVRPRAAIRCSPCILSRTGWVKAQRVQLGINPYTGEGFMIPVKMNEDGHLLQFQKVGAVLHFSVHEDLGLVLPEDKSEVTLEVKEATTDGVKFQFPDSCLLLKSETKPDA